jgi:hypothetical protein
MTEDFTRERETTSRDLFINKKGFSSLHNFSGKHEKYDDWNFTIGIFLKSEDHLKEFLKWIEQQVTMPTVQMCVGFDLDNEGDIETMNDQLCNFPCENLRDDALEVAKNMEEVSGINGICCWWTFQNECKALTGQQMQSLANSIYKPPRIKKYADVLNATEKYEKDVRRFECHQTAACRRTEELQSSTTCASRT